MEKLLLKWLDEKEKEILNSKYTIYKEGYLDAVMDFRNKIKTCKWYSESLDNKKEDTPQGWYQG